MLAVAEHMLRGELFYRLGECTKRTLLYTVYLSVISSVVYVVSVYSSLPTAIFSLSLSVFSNQSALHHCYSGKYDDGFWELNMAADLSDSLVYDEPWGWMQPPCHALGALNLEQVRGVHFLL